MKSFAAVVLLLWSFEVPRAFAQTPQVQPRIVTETGLERKVTVVEVAPRFVTTVRLPDAVNSVVVGDPSRFQVEHSDREPKLVFVKATSSKAAETNLLVSMINGQQVSLLLVSRGDDPSGASDHVDFLVRFELARGFSIPRSGFPSELVGETVPLPDVQLIAKGTQSSPSFGRVGNVVPLPLVGVATRSDPKPRTGLDQLLEQQESAPLPALYGQHIAEESVSGDRVRAGVSRVIDGGQQVIVLFSVVNPMKHAILLMPPQVQLGGKTTSGKVFHHKKWSTAEQLPVMDFRLSKRRIGPGERADGVVLFERPPYKQSNETLLLQVAESGAVDRPALAPIGFGISTASEDQNGRGK
ncbi:MAG TPA: hypothetical protein VFW94_09730 [Candidatus Acidoferrales bacterium]|nr:hypothetical protein [Candidatus Acidoferrales bacterium]